MRKILIYATIPVTVETVQAISSGKAMPSMAGFLNICDYFNISPSDFFDHEVKSPLTIKNITSKLNKLSDSDLKLFDALLTRFIRQ